MKRSTVDASTVRKATALVPLALLSAGWSVAMAISSAGASSDVQPQAVPPAEAVEAPASVTSDGLLRRALVPSQSLRVVQASTDQAIPAAALSAYQRAAQVMSTADPGCNVSWPLIAAIGRVESDHGRYGGSLLSSDGVAHPSIFGLRLNGSGETAAIADTDAGIVDRDDKFDRAVGPMQFIPSTWSVVGVDGDGDQKRNPQDIDDAALATAVYLCSGKDDLSTKEGADSAVFRYNHSQSYVALVTSIAADYASGRFATIPASSYVPVFLERARDDSVRALRAAHHRAKKPGPAKSADTHGNPTPATTPTEPAESSAPVAGDEPKADPVKQVLADAPATIEDTVDEGVGVVTELLDGLRNLASGLLPKQP